MTLSATLLGPDGTPAGPGELTIRRGPGGYRLPTLRIEPVDGAGGHVLAIKCDVISASDGRLADRIAAAYRDASGARHEQVTSRPIHITPGEIDISLGGGAHRFHGLLYVDYTELGTGARGPVGGPPASVPVAIAVTFVSDEEREFGRDEDVSFWYQDSRGAASSGWAPEPSLQQTTVEFDPARDTRVFTAPPAGAAEATHEPYDRPVAGPEPVRRRREGTPYPGVVAVDFGTSNCSVALCDPKYLVHRPLARPQQARLSALLAGLLETAGQDGGPPPVDPADLAERVGLDRGTPLREIIGRLAADHPTFPFTVGHALEQQWRTFAPAAQRRLAAALQEIYDQVFQVPALDILRLYPVTFEGAAQLTVLPTDVHVLRARPLKVHVGNKPAGEAPAVVLHGLKQYLGRSERIEGHPELDTRQVTMAALGFLLEESERFIETGNELESGTIDRVAMTYPVVAPPAVRHALAEMIERQGVRKVHRDFDEAVAAALFVLMRDFGGDHSVGIEAFRAQSRPLGDGDRLWHQNMLVVDIGGGTTDIALLSLVLEDATPPLPGVPQERQGRYYVLTPQLLGSTGRAQLGGDRLTLQVFHHLRAALADHVLTRGGPEAEALREQVAQILDPAQDEEVRYRPGRLLEDITAESRQTAERARRAAAVVVPTRWREAPESDRPAQRAVFEALWALAEKAKRHLGQAEATDFRPTGDEVSAVCDGAGITGRLADPAGGASWIEDVRTAMTLTPERFRQLTEPIIMEMVTLATAVAAQQLRQDRIDRIVLTGQTSQMPLVRNTFVTHFGTRGAGASAVAWTPGQIRAEEPEYAKLAVALGAAWGTHILVSKRPRSNRLPQLREGVTLLDIQVRNLKFFLPFSFTRSATFGSGTAPSDVLIETGTALRPTGPDGQYVARSSFDHYLGSSFFVYRSTFAGDPPLWGEFQYDTYAKRHEPDLEPELDRDLWENRVTVQLEVTSDLDLFIYLCRGDQPHLRVEDGNEGVVVPDAVIEDGQTPVLRHDIVLDAEVPGSRPAQGHPVFAAGAPFDTLLRIGDRTVRAMTGRLPDPPPEGWSFRLRRPGHHTGEVKDERLPTMPAPHWQPREEGERREYMATLDETGRLRVHLADLGYALVGSMRELQEGRDGDVLRLALPNKAVASDPFHDPFNGYQ